MLKIFEYIFVSTLKKYEKRGEKGIPAIYALAIVYLIQLTNLFTLLGLVIIYEHSGSIIPSRNQSIVIISCLLLLNGIYFFGYKKIDILRTKFNDGGYKRFRIWTWVYVVLSISLFIISFIVSKKVIHSTQYLDSFHPPGWSPWWN